MESSGLITQQIIASLKKRKLPIHMRYAEAAGNVVLDFSRDIGYLTYEYFDTENRWGNGIDTERLMRIIKKGNLRNNLEEITKIAINEFAGKIPEKMLNSLPEGAGKLTGSFFVNKVLMQDIASVFAQRLIPKICFNATLSTALLLGGARARAIYASRRLLRESPSIYYMLKNKGDLDLLYFLAEDYLEPFIKAISIYNKKPEEFYKIVSGVIDGLSN